MEAVLNFRGMLRTVPYHDYMEHGFIEALINNRFTLIQRNESLGITRMNHIQYLPVGRSRDYWYFEGEVYD